MDTKQWIEGSIPAIFEEPFPLCKSSSCQRRNSSVNMKGSSRFGNSYSINKKCFTIMNATTTERRTRLQTDNSGAEMEIQYSLQHG